MATKRLRKKKEKERLQRQLLSTQKYTEKEVKKLSYNETLSISERENKRQKRKANKADLRQRKVSLLESQGYDRSQFTLKQIDTIKIKDLQSGDFNRNNYPKIFRTATFDFDKIYVLKNSAVVQFAFRDFAGETSLEEILSQYAGLTPERLLDRIHELNSIRPTYSKGSKKKGVGNSSGAAGDYKFLCGAKSAAVANRQDANAENTRLKRHSKRKAHGAHTYNGYQFLKSNGHNTYTNEITPRNLLIVTCAIMENVTEWDRVNFYNRVYNDLVARHMPDLLPLLPYPQ